MKCLGKNVGRSPAWPFDHREENTVALFQLLAVQPCLAQEPFEGLRRRRWARSLDLFTRRFCLLGDVARDQDQPARCRVDIDRSG